MKKFFYCITSLLLVLFAVSSCIEDEEIETYPECSIRRFSIADIKSEIKAKTENGNDTSYYRTIEGKNIYFNIDQVNKTIVSVDSLPYWTDITRIVPTIESDGYVYYRYDSDSLFVPLNSGTDSIDFTMPVQFAVVSTSGMYTKKYVAKINKSINDVDSLIWRELNTSDFVLNGPHKSMALGNRIYVFSENNGNATVTSSSELSKWLSWRDVKEVEAEGAAIDYASICTFKDNFYGLSKDGYIFKSTGEDRGEVWTKVSDKQFERLLGGDGIYLYASDGETIMATKDVENWEADSNMDMDMLPEYPVTMISFNSRTNSNLHTTVMGGLSVNNSDNAVVWYKISSDDPTSNQHWQYMQITEENSNGCPRLENINFIRYDNCLWAMGGKNLSDDASVPYECFYRSYDNGLTWRKVNEKVALPQNFVGSDLPASIVVYGKELVLLQSGGHLWSGEISSAVE